MLKWVNNGMPKSAPVYTAVCPDAFPGDYFALSRIAGPGVRWQVWIGGKRIFPDDYHTIRTLRDAKAVAEAYIPAWQEHCRYLIGWAWDQAHEEEARRSGVSAPRGWGKV